MAEGHRCRVVVGARIQSAGYYWQYAKLIVILPPLDTGCPANVAVAAVLSVSPLKIASRTSCSFVVKDAV